MRALWRVFGGAAVVSLGTWWGGWLAPVAWGIAVGLLWPRQQPARTAALAALVAWALLLAVPHLLGDPVALLVDRLSAAMRLPTWALPVATLIFPALLAGCAARVASAVRVTPP